MHLVFITQRLEHGLYLTPSRILSSAQALRKATSYSANLVRFLPPRVLNPAMHPVKGKHVVYVSWIDRQNHSRPIP